MRLSRSIPPFIMRALERSPMPRRPLQARIALAVWLLLAAACSPVGTINPTPTYPPAPVESATTPPRPTVTPSGPAKPTEVKPTPVPVVNGSPVALRSDITIRKLLETGGAFVRMKRDPLTNTIYYMDGKANIYRLDVQDEITSTGTLAYSLADIGVEPEYISSGLAFGPDGTMYVLGNIADEETTHAVIRRGKPDAAGARTWTTLAVTEPYPKSNTQFDHVFNGIVVSPDGQYLYVNSGSRTDHGEVEAAKGAFPDTREVALTAAIFRIPTNADNQVLPNDRDQLKAKGYLFAEGTRNSYDPAFAPNGDLIAADNGPDADYPDELNWLREGHHYGFPWRLGNVDNATRSPDYDPSKDKWLPAEYYATKQGLYYADLTFPPPPEGVTFTDPIPNLGPDADEFRVADGSEKDASDLGQAAYSFTPHRPGVGLMFDAAGAVGGDLKGDGFILSWGAAGESMSDVGRDLLDLKLTKTGDSYQARMTKLAVGFDQPVDGVLIENRIYVLDYGGKGSIWEVTLP